MTNITMTGQTDVDFDLPRSYVLDPQMRRDLREPFPRNQIGKVNKGFGQVDFIGHAAVTDRLNQAAPGWTYRVEPVVITGKDGLPHVMAVFGTMTVGGVTRQEVGDVEHMSRYGDELKKAISDFIVRGAMRFGVGLDLWSKEDLSASLGEVGADAGGRVETTSSASRALSSGVEPREPAADSVVRPTPEGSSSEEGTTTAADEQGHRGTTADPSSDLVPPAAGPRQAKSPSAAPSRGAASKGGGQSSRRSAPSQDPVAEPPPPAGGPKYPLDPKLCKHTVGIDLDLRCVDCGTKMAEASP